MENRAFKGVWIPKELWFDNNIGWSAKLLLIEIDSLSQNGECFATNEYFANFFSLSKDRISKLISELKTKGYVEVKLAYKPGTKQIDKRIITTEGYRRKQLGVSVETTRGIGENNYTPIGENNEDNNTNINNTINKGIYKGISRFEDFWNAYPKQIHRTLAEQAYIKSLMGGSTEDWLVDAAKEYKLCMQGTESRFVKNPENWLADNCYLDYPPGTYAKRCEEQKKAAQAPPKAAKPTGTKFSNFEQRPYDFDDLESKLLQGF